MGETNKFLRKTSLRKKISHHKTSIAEKVLNFQEHTTTQQKILAMKKKLV